MCSFYYLLFIDYLFQRKWNQTKSLDEMEPVPAEEYKPSPTPPLPAKTPTVGTQTPGKHRHTWFRTVDKAKREMYRSSHTLWYISARLVTLFLIWRFSFSSKQQEDGPATDPYPDDGSESIQLPQPHPPY